MSSVITIIVVLATYIFLPLTWFAGLLSTMFSTTTRPLNSPATEEPNTIMKMDPVADFVPEKAGEPYEPTVSDVLEVRCMLSKAQKLPLELVNIIFDMAEYWPHATVEDAFRGFHIYGGRPDRENRFLLRTTPIGFTEGYPGYADDNFGTLYSPPPQPLRRAFTVAELEQLAEGPDSHVLEHPCRKIVFTIRSHDQGWSGGPHPGTYQGSWTWFQVGLEKFEAEDSSRVVEKPLSVRNLRPVIPNPINVPSPSSTAAGPNNGSYDLGFRLEPDQSLMVQANVHAKREFTSHRVVWSWTDDIDADSSRAEEELLKVGRGKATGNGEFVRNLSFGDVVTLWGHARFPAWVNTVDTARVDVYWAV